MSIINNLNCIVIIDDEIKPKLKTNPADLVIYRVDIISNIRELTEDLINKTKRVVIVGNYNVNGLEDLKLFKDILDLDLYFIGDDELMVRLMSKYCKSYLVDYTVLTSNLLSAVLYNDTGSIQKYTPTSKYLTEPDVVNSIRNNTTNELIINLCNSYDRLREHLDLSLKQEDKDIKEIARLSSQIINHLNEIDQSSRAYQELVEKVIKQNKLFKDFEIVFSKDLYEHISLSQYKHKPKILYFKEYQPLMHEYSFITTVVNAIRFQGGKSCKVLRLHDSDDILRIKTLEDRYKVINNEFLESDILANDLILSYGNYKKIMNLLLTNKINLDILIIYDCKHYEDVVVNGGGVAYFNVCRNQQIAEKLGLKGTNTIVNNGTSPLSWDTYINYDEIEDSSKLFEILSARDCIQRIFRITKEI